jgi:hypothetical protein
MIDSKDEKKLKEFFKGPDSEKRREFVEKIYNTTKEYYDRFNKIDLAITINNDEFVGYRVVRENALYNLILNIILSENLDINKIIEMVNIENGRDLKESENRN